LAMSGSFLLPVHNSPAAPATGEIRVQKRAQFPARLRLGLGVVLSWISSCFCLLQSPIQNSLERGVKGCHNYFSKCNIITNIP
jgi:hypothetical protein